MLSMELVTLPVFVSVALSETQSPQYKVLPRLGFESSLLFNISYNTLLIVEGVTVIEYNEGVFGILSSVSFTLSPEKSGISSKAA